MSNCLAVSYQQSAVSTKYAAFCLLLTACFPIMAATSYTKPIHNLTLQDAVRIGLKNSRELTMANLQQEQTKASLKETLSQAYPKIMGNIGSSYINLEKIGGIRTGTSPVLTTDGEGYSNNLSLSLNQILWTGGKVANAIKCSHKEIEISLLKIEEVKNETIYKIATSYWNLKKAIELKKVCEKRVDYAGSIMEIASVRYKEGLIPEVEVMKQEVNLAQAKEELIKASCSEKMAGDNLRSLLRMEGEINLIDEPAFVPLNIDEEKIVLEVMTTNSEIAGRKAETKSKELQVKIARADYLPNVNLIGSYNWSGENKDGFKKSLDRVSEDSWTCGINIEIPIFNGFYTASKVKEAKLTYKGAEENLNSLKDKITLETKEILARLLEAEERVRVSEKNKEWRNEILGITRVRYELGKATLSEVKEAEEIFIRSSTMQIEAVIDYNLCRMNLLRIMGKIGEGF
ncbi:TolC family protein [bacterium]|nr:TolC family protein [bacterium]MBU1153146.1 TolC family protein [bacterium]MBU1782119.1 TolC family protein [bacterium]